MLRLHDEAGMNPLLPALHTVCLKAQHAARQSKLVRLKTVVFPYCMAETQHAARLSKLAVSSQRSAGLFAARLRIARSETPGWRVLCSSPASFAGRLDLVSDAKSSSAVRLEAGFDFGTTFTGVTPPGYSQLCRKRRGTALGRCFSSQELIW